MDNRKNIVYLSTEAYPMGTAPQFIIKDGDSYFVVYAHVEFDKDSEDFPLIEKTFENSKQADGVRRVSQRSRLRYFVGPVQPSPPVPNKKA